MESASPSPALFMSPIRSECRDGSLSPPEALPSGTVDGACLTQNGADSRNLPRDDAVATSTAVLLDEFRRRDSREHLAGGVGHVERTFRCDVVAGRFVQ